jgi:hypothetical protein
VFFVALRALTPETDRGKPPPGRGHIFRPGGVIEATREAGLA